MKPTRENLEMRGLTPNKALGQNFLVDEDAIGRIAGSILELELPMLEIGPGLGAITAPLAESGLPIYAVELDKKLAGILNDELPENVHIVNEDFLKADISSIHSALGGGEIVVCGNLPYYITSDIASKLLLSGLPIKRMVLMMQREAAQRFTSEPGKKNYGPLTVLTKLQYGVQKLFELSPASYYPQPDVDSTVLVFDRLNTELHEKLPRVLKCAFSARRKTLANNLTAFGIPKGETETMLIALGLAPNVRAEAITPGEFAGISELLEEREI